MVLVGFLALVLGGFLAVQFNLPLPVFGSTQVGSEYIATSTSIGFNNYSVIRGTSIESSPTSSPMVLGSIIITTPGTSGMCFHDATSTRTNFEWATTTIACFPASAAAGTFVFDAVVQKGILVEFTNLSGATSKASTTITYRAR